MERVTLRNIRSSLGLGLLASLAAHFALFGRQHAVGGPYHALLLLLTSAIALGFVVFLGTRAWALSREFRSGSVVAARLREQFPGVGSVVASTALWYAEIEAVEPHHLSAPAIALLVTLTAASFLVLCLAHAMANAFAHAAAASYHPSFSPREPAWQRRPQGHLSVRYSLPAHRRFARPPPIMFVFPRA